MALYISNGSSNREIGKLAISNGSKLREVKSLHISNGSKLREVYSGSEFYLLTCDSGKIKKYDANLNLLKTSVDSFGSLYALDVNNAGNVLLRSFGGETYSNQIRLDKDLKTLTNTKIVNTYQYGPWRHYNTQDRYTDNWFVSTDQASNGKYTQLEKFTYNSSTNTYSSSVIDKFGSSNYYYSLRALTRDYLGGTRTTTSSSGPMFYNKTSGAVTAYSSTVSMSALNGDDDFMYYANATHIQKIDPVSRQVVASIGCTAPYYYLFFVSETDDYFVYYAERLFYFLRKDFSELKVSSTISYGRADYNAITVGADNDCNIYTANGKTIYKYSMEGKLIASIECSSNVLALRTITEV